MHAFDILAESKMREWEKRRRENRETSSERATHTTAYSTESYEKILYYNIRKAIIRAYMIQGEKRTALLRNAADMQVQLTSRLEKSGYNIISKMLSDEIQALKREARAADHDEKQLLSMLRDLED